MNGGLARIISPIFNVLKYRETFSKTITNRKIRLSKKGNNKHKKDKGNNIKLT